MGDIKYTDRKELLTERRDDLLNIYNKRGDQTVMHHFAQLLGHFSVEKSFAPQRQRLERLYE